MSQKLLTDFVQRAAQSDLNLHGIQVTQAGKTLDRHHWVPEEPHVLRSLSKSFASCAVGIAINEGLLSLDDKVIDFFTSNLPGQLDDRIRQLTVHHLLTMAHGRADSIMLSPQRAKITEPDWVRYFLGYPLDWTPGTQFVYDTGATYMLSAILQEITGEALRDYTIDRLFNPLGIDNPRWDTCPLGRSLGGAGLYITLSEISRFGNMLLNNGLWEGKQVVPQDYLADATRKQIETGDGGAGPDWRLGYGYQFWICPHNAYRGDGADSQFCIILPNLAAVVAITAHENRMQDVLNAVWETVLPRLHL